MINSKSGEITFSPSFVLNSGTKELDFVNSPEGIGLNQNDRNDGWSRYYPKSSFFCHGKEWKISLIFLDGKLNTVSLSVTFPEESESWDSWSESMEFRRKKEHDEFLLHVLGLPPYDFPWGEILSTYDPRGGSSSIGIRYK